jgi:hypothetical protein
VQVPKWEDAPAGRADQDQAGGGFEFAVAAMLDDARAAGAVITKDYYTSTIRNLRQERSLRDHGGALGRPM